MSYGTKRMIGYHSRSFLCFQHPSKLSKNTVALVEFFPQIAASCFSIDLNVNFTIADWKVHHGLITLAVSGTRTGTRTEIWTNGLCGFV